MGCVIIPVTFFVLSLFIVDGVDFLESATAFAGERRTLGRTTLVGMSGLVPLRGIVFFSFGLNTLREINLL